MTDKERAEKYRQIEKILRECDYIEMADAWQSQADQLDPPEPEIPDGQVWYRWNDRQDWTPGVVYYGEITGSGGRDTRPLSEAIGDGLYVIPAHTLAPGQVAVDRKASVEAEDLLRSEIYTYTADALQDALNRDKEANK